MARKPVNERAVAAAAAAAPITTMLPSRLMVLANLLRRSALLRYRRVAGLSAVEFGLVATLGRRPAMTVARLAASVGMDKGQISRALSGLVQRKLVAKVVNVRDSREVLVSLTKAGLVTHDRIVEASSERQRQLLQGLPAEHVQDVVEVVDRLIERAAVMLEKERRIGP
jgi:DNA-binding MarR family transcriptional regulator